MADNPASHQFDLVPEEARRQLVLPAEMINKGLELAIRIEQRQGLIKSAEPLIKFPGVYDKGSCVNFSRDGQYVATITYGKQPDNAGLVVWNVGMKGALSIFPEAGFAGADPRHFFSVALSQHGDFAFMGYGDGSLYRCDIINHVIRNYRCYCTPKSAAGLPEVTAISISPDDRYFATCSSYAVLLGETESGKEVRRFQGHNPYYNQITFSPDGRKLLVAHGEQIHYRNWWGTFITLFDLSGKQAPVLFGGERSINASSVAISPDNQIVTALDDDGIVTVWNAITSEEMAHWKHVTSTATADNDVISRKPAGSHMHMVWKNPMIWGLSDVAISPDGSRILSGGADHYMRLWTLDGRELQEFRHDARVVKVAFTPDGQRALSGCWNGSVYVWELP